MDLPLRAWVEVDLDQIAGNLEQIRQQVNRPVWVVVKANAYGLGAAYTARFLEEQGVDRFAVSFVDEAIALRQAGIKGRILVFSPLPGEEELYPDYQLEASLNGRGAAFSSYRGPAVPVHLKIDSGLGRFGFRPEELQMAGEVLNRNNLELVGTYTHFSRPGHPRTLRRELAAFEGALNSLGELGIDPGEVHAASSRSLRYPEARFDAVRAGNALLGTGTGGKSWRLMARVAQVKKLPAESRVGYEGVHKMRTAGQVAVVAIGGADGPGYLPGAAKGDLYGLLRGVKEILWNYLGKDRVFLGKLGMQLSMVRGESLQAGEALEVASRLLPVSATLPRVYLREGRVVGISRIAETMMWGSRD